MKKLSFLFVVAGVALFVACGPTKKEKEEALKKAQEDSMKAAEEAQRQADSIAMAAENQRIQDSINLAIEKAKQDSIAALEKKGKKK
jgi:hypothetical protein